MRFTINASSGLPIYRQIVRQVVDAIAGGQLVAGQRLSSHRELAAELVVAPLTIKKAYDELEKQGLVRMVRGQGTFVAEARKLSEADKTERLRPAVQSLVHESTLLGVPRNDLIKLVAVEFERAKRDKKQGGTR